MVVNKNVTSGRLDGVMVNTLAQNAIGVVANPALGTIFPNTCAVTRIRPTKLYTVWLLESLFYLRTPLEHIDFYIIGYWNSSMVIVTFL